MLLPILAPLDIRDTMPDTWAARDGLGREVPIAPRPLRKDRFVAMFSFLWQENVPGRGLYDLSKILAKSPPTFGPPGAFHWWGEPRLGYYTMDDPAVIRKHVQMLVDAGVDAMVFDVTNAYTYDANVRAVLKTFKKIRSEGGRVPGIAFITYSNSPTVTRKLYDAFYRDPTNDAFWFRWRGKPLILARDLPPDLAEFFTVRASWAWTKGQAWFGDGKDRWPWLDHTPQGYGWHESPDKPEEVAVATAEHPVSDIGRSFHDGKEPEEKTPEKGLYFAEQWRRAREVDPEMVFVTGWNEWIAQRFVTEGGQPFLGKPLPKGGTFFVDQYSPEYSRDIEPMRGGFGDAYYYQLASEIRRFKGARSPERPSAPKTIRIAGPFSQWVNVGPTYRDDLFDPFARDHAGWDGAPRYVDRSGRNDFAEARVARDGTSVAFDVQTREQITEPEGTCWMVLRVNGLVVNRVRSGNLAWVERDGKTVAKVPMRYAGRELHLALSRRLFPKGRLNFRFQWLDNVPLDDPMGSLDHGDAAPNGRFEFVYREP